MLKVILILLIVFWFLGYNPLKFITIPDKTLVYFNGMPITLWKILFLLIVVWLIGILPSPFRQIGSIVVLLWALSMLGILVIPALSSILAIVIIIGLIFYILGGSD